MNDEQTNAKTDPCNWSRIVAAFFIRHVGTHISEGYAMTFCIERKRFLIGWLVAASFGVTPLPAQEPELRATLETGPAGARVFTFSPDGKLLATGGGRTIGLVELWDVATEKKVSTLQRDQSLIYLLAFSRDGKTLASSDGFSIAVWDVEAGKERLTIKGLDDRSFNSMAFSPDSLILATGLGVSDPASKKVVAGEARLWDLKTGENTSTLKGHSGPVDSIEFSPDGRRLVSAGGAGYERRIKLWAIPDKKK